MALVSLSQVVLFLQDPAVCDKVNLFYLLRIAFPLTSPTMNCHNLLLFLQQRKGSLCYVLMLYCRFMQS